MIAIFDRDRVLRTVNEAFLEMRGLERRDVLGRPASEVLGASAFGRIEAHLSRCFGGETVELETRLVHPQRGIRNHVVRYYPVRSPTGDVDRVVEMVRDVTEFRRAEKEKGPRLPALDRPHVRGRARRLLPGDESRLGEGPRLVDRGVA
jgi:PAS domain S-box-containing protein